MDTTSLEHPSGGARRPGRALHLDLLRVLAIFLVVLNHSGAYLYYLQVQSPALRLLCACFSCLIKTAVPLFFMISGALLLEKEESLAELFRKRVLRYALVLILFSLASHLWDLYQSHGRFSLYFFLSRLYAYRFVDSYWFLYGYLGFLLGLPLLRRLAKGMRDRDFYYMIALMLGYHLVEIFIALFIKEELSVEGSFVLFPIVYSVFYPLFGYYLERRLPKAAFAPRGLWLSLALSLAAVLLMVLSTLTYCRRFDVWTAGPGEVYFWSLALVPAGGLYIQAKALYQHHHPGALPRQALLVFGSCSFGVYLLQHALNELLESPVAALGQVIGAFPAALLQGLLVCLLGTGITLLLKQIPGLKKLL